MENLTLMGIIYIIVGLVLLAFIFVALPLVLISMLIMIVFGIILMFMGRQNTHYGNVRYPMFMPCPACGKYINASSNVCPTCEKPTT
jgi:hypothetical protein